MADVMQGGEAGKPVGVKAADRTMTGFLPAAPLGGLTPAEAGMPLRRPPHVPTWREAYHRRT